MPFKGKTNIIFIQKSAVFTSSSDQLTSWVRDRLKVRAKTVGELHSCVLFPYKAGPTLQLPRTMWFFSLLHREAGSREKESSGLPIRDDTASNARMTVFISFPLSESVHISIPERQVRGVIDCNYGRPFSLAHVNVIWLAIKWRTEISILCHCLDHECACLRVLWL